MKNKILLAVAGLAILPATSQASIQIRLFDGTNTLIVADNGAGDASPVIGIDVINQTFAAWSVNLTVGSNLLGTTTSPALNLTSFNFTYNGTVIATPLQVLLTDTGYGPTPGFFDLHIGGTQNIGGAITSKYFYDAGNGAFAESNQIGTTQSFSSASYSNDQLGTGPGGMVLSPYSLTMEVNIQSTPGAFISQFTSSISTPAPGLSAVSVPAAVWLFGTGLMGLLYSGKRKQMFA